MACPRAGVRSARGAVTLLASVALGLGGAPALLPSPALAADSGGSGGAVPPATVPAAAATPSNVTTVTLLTGDTVTVPNGPNAGHSVLVRPAPTPAGSTAPATVRTFTQGGDVFVVPAAAAPYYGRQLDPSLFDVTDLARRAATGGTPTVHIDWAPGASHHALAGLSDGARLDAARGRFAAALTAQSASDRTGGSTGGGLFAGVRRLSVAGSAASSATADSSAGTRFTMHTLTIRAKDLRGQPLNANGLATVQNLDNRDTFQSSAAFYKGRVSFSVPEGHYNVIVSSRTFDPDGTYVGDALVFDPQLSVHRETRITLNASRATTRVWVPQTPKPTSYEQLQVKYTRITPLGQQDMYTQMLSGGTPILYVSPARQTRGMIGQTHFYAYFRLVSPADAHPAYTYDVNVPYDGQVPTELPRRVDPATLATVDVGYYADAPGRVGFEYRDSFFGWEQTSLRYTPTDNLTAPLRRTEYVSGVPDLRWQHTLWPADFTMLTVAPETVYTPGQHATEDFLRAPLHPDAREQTTVRDFCRACRQGDQLQLNLSSWSGNQPGPAISQPGTGGSMSATSDLRLYHGADLLGSTQQLRLRNVRLPMVSQPGQYRLQLDTTKVAPWSTTTAASHTTWTFSSARSDGSLPAQRECFDRTQNCAFLPLLYLGYDVPVDLFNSIQRAGPVTMTVDVRHQMYQPAPSGTHLGVAVSFDDGATWSQARVADQQNGRFTVSFDQPTAEKTSGYVSLHATATDADGATVDQTLLRAYQVRPADGASTPTAPSTPDTGAACAPLPGLTAHCMAVVNAADSRANQSAAEPLGYGPDDLTSAYRLPSERGEGQVVAIVDAFDDPNVEADLAAYRAHYGLPPCTSDNGCFTKVNQRGAAGPLPFADTHWGTEISLDVDMVSAVCPRCRIILVEADSPGLADLGAAVDTAVALGADVVSNSYGTTGEPAGEWTFDRHYHHPGHAIVAASGDFGYNASYPAVSDDVVSVGGTTLRRDGSERGWSESVWSGTGGGCSAYVSKPRWQHDRHCPKRMMNDLAAVADPDTGVAVYDTFGQPGWVVVGGTSAGAPIVSAAYALAGHADRVRDGSGLYSWYHRDDFFDVVGGTNATQFFTCYGDYICTGVKGFDGPTGLGTPNGIGAFR